MADDLQVDEKLKTEIAKLYDPTTGKWGEKYDSADQMLKGIKEAGNALSTARKEADDLRKKTSQYEEFLLSYQGNKQGPTPGYDNGYSGELNPLKELSDMGIPTEPILRAIDKRAEEKALEAVKQTFGPFLGTAQARDLMVERYPDYSKQETDVLAHIGKDPALKQAYERAAKTGDPELLAMALDNGRLKWIEAGGGDRKSAADDAATKAAKAAASLPSGGGTGRAAVPNDDSDRQKQLEAARAKYWQDKDEAAFVRTFDNGQPLTWNDLLAAQQKQG